VKAASLGLILFAAACGSDDGDTGGETGILVVNEDAFRLCESYSPSEDDCAGPPRVYEDYLVLDTSRVDMVDPESGNSYSKSPVMVIQRSDGSFRALVVN